MALSFSVIIPTYQEIKGIENVLSFCVKSHPLPKQVFVVDGGSTDGTLDIVRQFQKQYAFLKLIDNPERYVAFGLNKVIPLCQSDIIIRMDAHTEYASDYFNSIVSVFERIDADIVGGPTNTAYESSTQEAIAFVYTSPFGMGNSSVHNLQFEGYTDSVTFGAWKSKIFKTTGLFDTSLKRNQDDEFHYRAKQLGFKIYQTPKVRLKYFPRNSFQSLFSQYFQFGLYKPLVLKKIHSGLKVRHIVPSALVLNIIMLLVYPHVIFLFPMIVYTVLLILFSCFNQLSFIVKFKVMLAYFIIHLGYGIGFLMGMFIRK